MRPTSTSPRRGSAMVGLIVLICLGVFGAGLLLPAIGRNRETATRIACANNIKQLCLSLVMYANDNRGAYPRTIFTPGNSVIPDVSSAGADSGNPFAIGTTVPPNCIPSSLFLVLRTEDITARVLVCPSTALQFDMFNNSSADHRSNFTDVARNLGYSYANAYPDRVAEAAGYSLGFRLDPGFPVIADLNPGLSAGSNPMALTISSSAAQLKTGNSHNHNGSGQNVGYADGHVEFDATPLVGLSQDNIYCRAGAGAAPDKSGFVNSPRDATDAILLPAAGY